MILVLNCGSQSVKWKLFDIDLKLAEAGKVFVLKNDNYQEKIEQELEKIKNKNVSLIGHRIVHGGDKFKKPTEITENVLQDLEKLSVLAPIHNPYNVLGIKACQKIFNKIKNIAVFDTEFFADLPEKVITCALPEGISKKFGFKKFGFHGISHEYVAKEASEKIKKPFKKLKIITCHLGGGASITAIKNGKPIDTSMGFTPMEGLVMMTRPGNIDVGIILELVKEFGVEQTNKILNENSGIKGICDSDQMLEVLEKLKNRNKKAKLAFDVFVYSIQKYIGAYFAILGGCDLLVFTGSIGAGNPKTRNAVCKGLDILNKTKILAIKTDEELAIAEKIIKIK
jgi:acetate kinase